MSIYKSRYRENFIKKSYIGGFRGDHHDLHFLKFMMGGRYERKKYRAAVTK